MLGKLIVFRKPGQKNVTEKFPLRGIVQKKYVRQVNNIFTVFNKCF
jgi:hypothetical protein